MANHDWVCKNCFAQNPDTAAECRVCGLPAPKDAHIVTEAPPPTPTPPPRPTPPARTKPSAEVAMMRARIISLRLTTAYRIVTAVWAVLLVYMGILMILGTPVWLLWQHRGYLPGLDRLAQTPGHLVFMLWLGSGRLSSGRSLRVLAAITYPFVNIAGCTVEDWFITQKTLGLTFVALWTVRLILRTLAGAESSQRRCRRSMLRLSLEALVLNLVYLPLAEAGKNIIWYSTEPGRVFTSLFALETIGIAVALLALILWMVVHRDWIVKADRISRLHRFRYYEAFDERPLRVELITGVVALAINAALTVVLSMAAF